MNNLDEDMEFKLQRYDNLLEMAQKNYFNYETEIVYNKKYQNIEYFRMIAVSLFRSITRSLT
jgi:hypothetical protein